MKYASIPLIFAISTTFLAVPMAVISAVHNEVHSSPAASAHERGSDNRSNSAVPSPPAAAGRIARTDVPPLDDALPQHGVIGASQFRRQISDAYANSPTFRALYDAVNHDPELVVHLQVTARMHNYTRGVTVPKSLIRVREAGDGPGSDGSEDARYVGSQFDSTLPCGADAALLGHELKHILEGAHDGYRLTPSHRLVPLAPTTRENQYAIGSGVSYESEAALDVERAIRRELRRGDHARLTTDEERDVFGEEPRSFADRNLSPESQVTLSAAYAAHR